MTSISSSPLCTCTWYMNVYSDIFSACTAGRNTLANIVREEILPVFEDWHCDTFHEQSIYTVLHLSSCIFILIPRCLQMPRNVLTEGWSNAIRIALQKTMKTCVEVYAAPWQGKWLSVTISVCGLCSDAIWRYRTWSTLAEVMAW